MLPKANQKKWQWIQSWSEQNMQNSHDQLFPGMEMFGACGYFMLTSTVLRDVQKLGPKLRFNGPGPDEVLHSANKMLFRVNSQGSLGVLEGPGKTVHWTVFHFMSFHIISPQFNSFHVFFKA